jgi:cytochrome c553
MRIWGILVLLTAACQQQQASAPPKAAEITFDGAGVTDAAARVAHGERLTHVLGCTGCHNKGLVGDRFYELYASNLTREIPKYSDAQFDRLLRHGERPNGKDLDAMPSEVFQHLSNADTADLLAYLRTLRPRGIPTQPALPFTEETKKLIAAGELKPAAEWVRLTKDTLPVDLGPQYALGRYITEVTCAECHGPDLKGDRHPGPGAPPNLVVAGGYSRAEFEKLITQGVPTGNRKLNEMMSDVAKTRFTHLTPHERDALYAYLHARAESPEAISPRPSPADSAADTASAPAGR